jgi:hypothetical protein
LYCHLRCGTRSRAGARRTCIVSWTVISLGPSNDLMAVDKAVFDRQPVAKAAARRFNQSLPFGFFGQRDGVD